MSPQARKVGLVLCDCNLVRQDTESRTFGLTYVVGSWNSPNEDRKVAETSVVTPSKKKVNLILSWSLRACSVSGDSESFLLRFHSSLFSFYSSFSFVFLLSSRACNIIVITIYVASYLFTQ